MPNLQRHVVRMPLAELLHLLRRPLAPTAPEPQKPPRRGAPAEPLPPLPVTETELVAALDRVQAERTAAEDAITEASSRRERLLLDPASDDAILEADRDLDRAQLALERLDALEPQLHQRLRALRNAARCARWIELRDQYVGAGRRHADLAEALEAERATWEAARQAVLAQYPDAHQVLPDWPLPPAGAVAAFPGQLDRLAATVHDPEPGPVYLMRSVADLADEARRTGRDPDLGVYPELRLLLAERVRVRFHRACRDGSGVFHEAGTETEMPGAEARAEVQAGRGTIISEDI